MKRWSHDQGPTAWLGDRKRSIAVRRPVSPSPFYICQVHVSTTASISLRIDSAVMSVESHFQAPKLNKRCAVRDCNATPGPGTPFRRCRAQNCYETWRFLCPDHRFSDDTCIFCATHVGDELSATIPCAVIGCAAEQIEVIRLCSNPECISASRYLCNTHWDADFGCFFLPCQ